MQGRIQDFKLNKLHRAKGGAKIFGVFRVKNHDFTPINHIFSNFRGGGRAPGAPPPLDPPLCLWFSWRVGVVLFCFFSTTPSYPILHFTHNAIYELFFFTKIKSYWTDIPNDVRKRSILVPHYAMYSKTTYFYLESGQCVRVEKYVFLWTVVSMS